MIVAAELGAAIRLTSGPALERAGDLAAMLSNLVPGDVLFIDEIHRIARPAEEMLYLAMEDFRVDVVVGKGPGATSIPLDIAPFTLVGATTRSGALTGPLRDRFGFTAHMEFYEPDELERVLRRAAVILGVDLRPDGAEEIAGRSRGTPRIANRLLRRVRDFAEVRADGTVTVAWPAPRWPSTTSTSSASTGWTARCWARWCAAFGGGPVGVSTLAVAVGEEAGTVEEVCEPFLVRAGMLARTPRGRVATAAAWAHLGVSPPPDVPGRPLLRCSDGSAGRLGLTRHDRRYGDRRTTMESLGGLLFPLLILLLFIPIFLSGRKQRRQAQEQQQLQSALEAGDVVTTTSGLRGTIVDASYEDTVDLEIADGVVTTGCAPRSASGSLDASASDAPTPDAVADGRRRGRVGRRRGRRPRGHRGAGRRDDVDGRRPPRRERHVALVASPSRGRPAHAGRETSGIHPRAHPALAPPGGVRRASSSCSTRWCSSPATRPPPSSASICRAAPGSR